LRIAYSRTLGCVVVHDEIAGLVDAAAVVGELGAEVESVCPF
jgi:hypothetical protein